MVKSGRQSPSLEWRIESNDLNEPKRRIRDASKEDDTATEFPSDSNLHGQIAASAGSG
jgi:hypothetical protein